jgi:hypothetical protein
MEGPGTINSSYMKAVAITLIAVFVLFIVLRVNGIPTNVEPIDAAVVRFLSLAGF